MRAALLEALRRVHALPLGASRAAATAEIAETLRRLAGDESDPEDRPLAQAIADTVGLLGTQLQIAEGDDDANRQRGFELDALRRVADTLGRTLDLERVLESCLDFAEDLLGADTCTVHLFDEETQMLDLAAHRHLPADAIAHTQQLAVSKSLFVRRAMARPAPISIRRDDENLVPASKIAFRRAGTELAIMVPLMFGERLVGLMSLGFIKPREFSPSQTGTLMAIGEQEAVAIDRARVHTLAELRARLALVLREVAVKVIAGDRPGAVSEALLDGVTQICRSPVARYSTFDGDGRMVTDAARGYPPELLAAVERIPSDDVLLRRILASPTPVILSSADALPPASPITAILETGFVVSLVVMPLRLRGRLLGLLTSPAREPRRFHREELAAMELLMSLAASALDNDRLRRAADAEHRRLGQVVDRLPYPIAVVGSDLRFESANPAYCALTGQGATPGGSFPDHMRAIGLTRADGTPILFEELAVHRALGGEEPAPLQTRFRSPTGLRTVQAMAMPLRDDTGAVIAAVIALQDITELRELADAKDHFLAIASHELRSPIASLTACIQLLDLDPTTITDAARRNQLLDRVRHQVDRLCRIVDELIDTTRLRADALPVERAPMDLVAVAREAIELAELQPCLHRLRLEAPAPVEGLWDRHRVAQIVTNLLGNALRYSPDGSEIEIAVRREGEEAVLTVTDHGIGIAPALQQRVFEPFVRGREAGGRAPRGLGLGLFITREIVRRHQGRISVASELGKGTRFSVHLPLRPPS